MTTAERCWGSRTAGTQDTWDRLREEGRLKWRRESKRGEKSHSSLATAKGEDCRARHPGKGPAAIITSCNKVIFLFFTSGNMFLTTNMVKHQNRLSREAVEPLHLLGDFQDLTGQGPKQSHVTLKSALL